MASNRIKGITIEIGGDTKNLVKSLKGVDTQLKETQAKLNDVNKLLKLDPKNTELLKQKQKALGDAINGTKERLEQLKSAQTDALSTDEYDALQREIIATEQDLKGLTDQYKDFGSVGVQKLKEVGSQLQAAGDKMTEVGEGLTKYLTGPIVGMGAAAVAAFNEVDGGMDVIIKKTGATGEALDEMGDIMKEIATEIPTDFETAGTAIGEVNTRFGVNGEQLKALSEQYIKFAELNDQDVTSAVDSTQKALESFGLSADDASGFLDTLTKVSQNTGIDVATLTDKLTSNSTALQAMGLDINDAATMMGQLEVSGADSSAVMDGLSKALKNAEAKGYPLGVTLGTLQKTIAEGTDSTDGLTEAYKLFGKSGAEVFKAVKDGALDFTALQGAAEDASGTVTDTFNATLDPADQFTTAMNALKETGAAIAETVMPLLSEALGKVQEVVLTLKEKWDGMDEGQQKTILTIAGIVAAVGPALAIFGKLTSSIGNVVSIGASLIGKVQGIIAAAGGIGPALGSFIWPTGVIIAGLVAGAVLIYKHWDEIKEFVVMKLVPRVKKAWEVIQEKVNLVFTAIKGYWDDTLRPALEALWSFIVETVVPKAVAAWEQLKQTADTVFTAIKGFWDETLKPALEALWKFVVDDVVPKVEDAWNSMKSVADTVFTAIKGFWDDTLKPAFEAIGTFVQDTLWPIIEKVFGNIKDTIDNSLNAIKKLWEDTVKPIYEGIVTFFEGVFSSDMEKAWSGIQSIAEGVWNAITTCVTLVVETAKTWGGDLIKNFKSSMETAWNTAKTFVLGLWDKITEKVEEIWEGAKKWGSNIIGNFYASVVEAWNRAVAYVTGIWDAITDKVTEIWEGAKQWGSNIIGNFYASVVEAWGKAVDYVTGIWDSITNKVTEIWNGAMEWGGNIITNFKTSLENAWNSVVDFITGIWDVIPEAINGIIDSALKWGEDLIKNFVDGLKAKWEQLKQDVLDIPQKIKDWIGFSQPKEGPLSDFDTYAPDMIELFVKGINDSVHLITTAMGNMVNNIKVAFKLAGEGGQKAFNTSLNGEDGNAMKNIITGGIKGGYDAINVYSMWSQLGSSIRGWISDGYDGYWHSEVRKIIFDPVKSAYDQIGQLNWWDLGQRIRNGITGGLGDIGNLMRNAFDFSNMYVKTPHWWVDRWDQISGTYFPVMSVHWYRKAYDDPVLFNRPTVIPTAAGLKGFGDGPGGEVVLSAAKLRELTGAGSAPINTTVNVYAQQGQSAEQIATIAAQKVQQIMVREQNQRRAAYA